MTTPLGLYCHIPFCASTCDFCAFYQKQPQREELVAYLEGMRAELALHFGATKPVVETVFWGGGTPSLLLAKDMETLGCSVLDSIAGPPKEWTVELAPGSVRKDKIEMLIHLGVNRFSMGVQTFDAQVLEKLGRMHTPKQVDAAYTCIRNSGVRNLNLDLMLALPGQTEAQLRADLTTAISLDPEHISLYCLTFEEDTKLYLALSQGKIKRNPELEADLYTIAWDLLEQAGYEHYEIANFCKKGHACQHNLNTWKMHSWLGIGPSAASQYKGYRTHNVPSIQDWLQGVKAGKLIYRERTPITPDLLASDSLIFGLRMGEGLDLNALKQRFPQKNFDRYTDLWADLLDAGLLTQSGSRIALTRAGKLLADAVARRIMELE